MLVGLRYRNLTHLQQQSRRHLRQVDRKLKTMIHPRPCGRDAGGGLLRRKLRGLSAPAWARPDHEFLMRASLRSIRAHVGATLVKNC